MNELYNQILKGMLEFIEGDEDAEYSPSDVSFCGELLTGFSSKISAGISYDAAIREVKTVVLALNELNERCDFSIIETDQREDICEFIFQTLTNAGVEFEGDVTEEWRDW